MIAGFREVDAVSEHCKHYFAFVLAEQPTSGLFKSLPVYKPATANATANN